MPNSLQPIILIVGLAIVVGCDAMPSERDRLGRRRDSEVETLVRVATENTGDAQTREDFGQPADLPLPSTLLVNDYEQELFSFLKQRDYIARNWLKDKSVRDTGPYINGVYYGTHPAVRVFYSPGIIRWLLGGRNGPIPDGEMIIKEQYAPPAAQHAGKTEEELRESLESWTIMVKDQSGSHDGWFWSNPGADAKPFDYHANNDQPYSGFGLYCIRCHASTKSPSATSANALDNEFTFSALRNIEGFPGEPIIFRVDDSWRKKVSESHPSEPEDSPQIVAEERIADNAFSQFYREIGTQNLNGIANLPATSHDCVPANRSGAINFATSNQCMSCHAGLTGPLGPVGFVHTDENTTTYGGKGINVSPYGEWRWTPMGLAGRDPVFYAQVESEVALIQKQFGPGDKADATAKILVDACLRCHGAMGHEHFHSTAAHDDLMTLQDVHAKSNVGALAREGISCMVCHRMQPRPQQDGDTRPYLAHFLETSITGNLHLGPADEIFGPYKDDQIAAYSMHHATGLKPKHSNYIQQSQMCGTCHTVSLPTIDHPLEHEPTGDDAQLVDSETVPEFQRFHHHVEQATYLEWLNSQFNNETNPNVATGQSCQDCHMPDHTFADETGTSEQPVNSRIAAIQDDTYPDAENLSDHKSLNVRVRNQYRRHGFAGLNVWLLEYFKQFESVLGVKSQDYMTGSDRGAQQAIAGMVRMAQQQTATLSVDATVSNEADNPKLEAKVTVTNLAGHRFPTGVGFRRAFIEFLVLQETEEGNRQVIWSSGQTNQLGVILGEDGEPLPTELFSGRTSDESYQPHHAVITSPTQVQIYETLLKDNFDRFTTSFVRGCQTVKDNRLLPKGWSIDGPGAGLTGAYLKATHPGPLAANDDDFTDGRGQDSTLYQVTLQPNIDVTRLTVAATVYYQATPPYYLNNLFKTSPDGDATKRLHALASHVNLKGTPIADWKLAIASVKSEVRLKP